MRTSQFKPPIKRACPRLTSAERLFQRFSERLNGLGAQHRYWHEAKESEIMSFLSWFTRKAALANTDSTRPAELEKVDAAVAVSGRGGRLAAEAAPADAATHRKNERMERRELLYTVVRDAMVRAGVLSASYKFKVLSLDQRGSQFLIMMDLAREFGGDTGRLSEIEALIAQTAKSRYEIAVTAVYWRVNDHVAVGIPLRSNPPTGSVAAAHRAAAQAPGAVAPLPAAAVSTAASDAKLSVPAAAATATLSTQSKPVARPPPSIFDPIEADEVLAFRKALGNAGAGSAASAPGVAIRTGPMRRPVADDFADTEMTNNNAPASDLSGTQYGDL